MTYRIDRSALYNLPEKVKRNPQAQVENGFDKVLKEKIEKKEAIKLSSHAEKRLMERQIHLHKGDMDKLETAIDKLDEKGAKESLMIYKDMAFIASIKNRTIITAMGNDDLDIVTNIDSAVMVK